MDGWNTTFLLGRPIFRGYVSFREGINHPFWGIPIFGNTHMSFLYSFFETVQTGHPSLLTKFDKISKWLMRRRPLLAKKNKTCERPATPIRMKTEYSRLKPASERSSCGIQNQNSKMSVGWYTNITMISFVALNCFISSSISNHFVSFQTP